MRVRACVLTDRAAGLVYACCHPHNVDLLTLMFHMFAELAPQLRSQLVTALEDWVVHPSQVGDAAVPCTSSRAT